MKSNRLNHISKIAIWLLLLIAIINNTCTRKQKGTGGDFEVVIMNGRVIDPGSNLDAVRNIGIADGKIQIITVDEITGKSNIDANGLVVSPGFIDIHQHGQECNPFRSHL